MEGHTPSSRLAWPNTLTWLRLLILFTLILLAVQYVLGMEVNLYSTPPYSSSDLVFNLHYSLGIINVAFGLAVLAVSVLTRKATTVLTSFVGFVAVAAAGQAGRMFAFTGQGSIYSLAMSIGFIIAFSSYFSEVLSIRRILSKSPNQ
jgi:hypothetical protein